METDRSLFLPFPQERHSCLLISQPGLCRYCWSLWWSCVLRSIRHGAVSPADPGSHKPTWGIRVVTGLFLWFSQKLPQILCKLRLPGAAEWTSILFQFSPSAYILAKLPTQLKSSVGRFPWATLQLKPCVPAWQGRKPPSFCLGSNTPCSTIFCVDIVLTAFRLRPSLLATIMLGCLTSYVDGLRALLWILVPMLHHSHPAYILFTCLGSRTHAGLSSQVEIPFTLFILWLLVLDRTIHEALLIPTGSDSPLNVDAIITLSGLWLPIPGHSHMMTSSSSSWALTSHKGPQLRGGLLHASQTLRLPLD